MAVLALAGVGLVGFSQADAQPRPSDPGARLYLTSCSSCHGVRGEGTAQGPSLVGVGAASADFQLSTGRMPLDDPRHQAQRKRPAFDDEQIGALTAYVASLGPGPAIPSVHPQAGELQRGSQVFVLNCAACHSVAGAGGSLGRGLDIPSLRASTPVQVAEAVRTGPGSMPVFGPDALSDHDLDSIARYLAFLYGEPNRGGVGLGRVGPITEGFVAWLVGLGLLIVAIRWIGERE